MEANLEVYDVGEFEVDLSRAELRRGGATVPLPRLPFELLKYLIEEHPRAIRHAEAIKRLWPDEPGVDKNSSLKNLLARLNKTLVADPEDSLYIKSRGGEFITLEKPPIKRIRVQERQPEKATDLKAQIPNRLLSYLWSYPLRGEAEASWAVKESGVLRGYLGSAREQPSLGVAIVTSEIALAAFGESATSRLERCISWAIARAEPKPPHRMLVETRDPVTTRLIEVKHDLRHTLAFAVVLARARTHYSYLNLYVKLAVSLQRDDGGFPPDGAITTSEVFTVFYAVELLHLATNDSSLPAKLRSMAKVARDRGIQWLMRRNTGGLWSTGVLTEFQWDGAVATAWVLHRLLPTWTVPVKAWQRCLENSLVTMIQCAIDPKSWAGTPDLQRHRVEARIAAAASRAAALPPLSLRSRDAVRVYLGAWRERTEEWLTRLADDELDVGTVAFLIDSLVPAGQLGATATTMLERARTDKSAL